MSDSDPMRRSEVSKLKNIRLTRRDLEEILGLKKSAFYKWQKLGRFREWEILPRIGNRAYSATKVKAYLDAERVSRFSKSA